MDRLSTNGQMLSQVELQKLPHSSFDMANHNFISGKLGKLIPTRIDEVYPGDTIKGHVQAVANFEPLAGPIMASMVMKQESFYVALFDIWKNAFKFFTAKKGFNTPVPSVSPKQVWTAYRDYGNAEPYIHLIASIKEEFDELRDIAVYMYDDDNPPVESITACHENIRDRFETMESVLTSFGNNNGVLDLLQPVIDNIHSQITHTTGTDIKDSALDLAFSDFIAYVDTETPDVAKAFEYFRFYVQILMDVLKYQYTYFFGPSSLLDYVGWPVMDNWDEYFATLVELACVQSSLDDYEVPYMDDKLFSDIPLNWLKFRALYVCWYWNYRDQLLEADAYDPEDDAFVGDNVSKLQVILLTLLRVRCWYKDTYTTALTNTGTGNFKVPIGSDPLTNTDVEWSYYVSNSGNNQDILLNTKDYAEAFNAGATIARVTIGSAQYEVPMNYLSGVLKGGYANEIFDYVDGTSDYNLSLDLFDRLRRLQSFTQKELLLGYEADDVVYAHFMVRLSNIRMHIPQLLARGRDEVQINTIVNNTDVPNGQPAGDKTAVAWSQGRTSDISFFAEEWGYFINFLTILPIQSYTGGLDRSWLKLQRFDFAWPDFATMGMDAIYNCELSAPRGTNSNAGLSDVSALAVFGYQGRYYDLKSKKDESHGRLRTDLHYLTFSREWNEKNPPKLNYIFVHCWPRLDMFVTDDPNADVIRQIDVYHDIDYHRAFPVPSEYLG